MPAKLARSPEGDTRFFTALENGHPVRTACKASGYSRTRVYEWRSQDPKFDERWRAAQKIAGDLLDEEADRRGRDGYDEPVFFQGEKIGVRRKYSDGLLTARMKAVKPEQYRERISMPSISQQNLTVVIRDFDAEDEMLKLVGENKLSVSDLPPRMQARLMKPADEE